MWYWVATILAGIHALVILVNVAGATVVLRGRMRARRPLPLWQYGYLGLAALGGLSASIQGDCVLTTWEKRLRELDRPGSAYEDSFVAHYLPMVPTPVMDWLFVLLALAALVGAVQVASRSPGLGRNASPTRSGVAGVRLPATADPDQE